jgi:diguanylate cyclase (GGDEF)-like protein/PAS domain S-box-containing protein
MNNTNNKIMSDIAILYELSLAIGQSLDLEENCDLFCKTLMTRKNFGYASVWVKNKYLPDGNNLNFASLVYANPEYYITEKQLPLEHPLFANLKDKPLFVASAPQEEFRDFVSARGISNGVYLVFALKDIGFIKLFTKNKNYLNDKVSLNQLVSIISKFTVSLEGCLAYKKLDLEIRERQRAEDALRGAYDELELRVRERTKEIENANRALKDEISERRLGEKKIQQQKDCLFSLHETALALMNRLDVKDLLETFVVRAGALLGTPNGFIYLIDAAESTFELKAGVGYDAQFVGYRIKRGEGLAGKVWQTNRTIAVSDYQNWSGRQGTAWETPLRASIAVPLKSGAQVIGAIGLNYLEGVRYFDENEIDLLSRLAELVSLALDNARLYTEAQQELSERKKVEVALRKSEAKNRGLVDAIPDSMFRINKDGAFLDTKITKDTLALFPPGSFPGKTIFDAWPPELAQQYMIHIGQVIKTRRAQVFEHQFPVGGEITSQEIRIVSSGEDEVLAIVRDITERKKMEEQLHYLSLHDSVTGLYNRTYFEWKMRLLGENQKTPVSIIVCDVDGLKLINDTMGHTKGDKLLILTANVIKKCFDNKDIVARIGGDEFAIIMFENFRPTVESAYRRIRDTVAEYNAHDPEIPLSISVGFAVGGENSSIIGDIFREADNNMYREKLHRSQSNRSSVVHALTKALEARDYITEGHADRLQEMVASIGEVICLSDRRISDLRLFAQFHDIGKVGIPDKILFKPGALSPEEFTLMQRHCEIGYRIAQSAPDLVPIAGWILMHHEWWNGQGYPLGIGGEEIPLECRILAIADAFDAMTSDRPYRKAKSHADALSELRRCAGTQFDPQLVEDFARVLENRKTKMKISWE